MKNSLSSIVKLRKLSFFELKFSVKSVHKTNTLYGDFFDKALQ